MSRPCSICAEGAVGAINALLADHSIASVARERGLSEPALRRHAHSHIRPPETTPTAPSGGPRPEASDPLAELVEGLRSRALAGDASMAREYRLALAALEARRAASVSAPAYVDSAEWIDLRTRLLAALQPYPEARLAVAEALA